MRLKHITMSIYRRQSQISQKKQETRKEKHAAQWLLSLVNDTCWGKKTADGPRPVNVKKAILGAINRVRGCWLKRPTIKAVRQHYHKEATCYFTGRRNDKARHDYRTLLLIDIDCHKSGTLEGAKLFARHLADNHFPGLYWEPSTNGNGVHGYLVIEKAGWTEEEYNQLLGKLEVWLKQILAATALDVENVEIKGRCPLVTWTEDIQPRFSVGFSEDCERHWQDFRQVGTVRSRCATAITTGTLAKMPRDIVALHERGTFETTANDLCILVNEPVSGTDVAVEEKEGSCTGKFIDVERIGNYLPIAHELIKDPAAVGGRVQVVVEDMAIALTILEYCSLHVNEDGSMPQRRVKRIWESLYKAGAVKRTFDAKRFAYMRNLLSNNDLIDWQDGEYGPGQACKWTLSQELLDKLEVLREDISQNTTTKERHTHTLEEQSPVIQWIRRQIDENVGHCGPRPCQTAFMRPVGLPSSEEIEAIMGLKTVAA